jgi:hypothetical protein
MRVKGVAPLTSIMVAWPGQIDLAPDATYQEIKAKEVWVLA